MMCFAEVIMNRTKGKQALCISSNRGVRIPLLVSTQEEIWISRPQSKQEEQLFPIFPSWDTPSSATFLWGSRS